MDIPVKSASVNDDITFGLNDFTDNFYSPNNLAYIKVLTRPANGDLKLSGTNVNLGTPISASNLSGNNLIFTPNNCWVGSTNFTWNAGDGNSYAQNPAYAYMNINDTPPTVSDVTVSGNKGEVITFNLSNFSEKYHGCDGNNLLKIKVLSLPPNGTLKRSDTGRHVNANDEIPKDNIGNLTFTPNDGWTGTTSFSWKGCDEYLTYSTQPATVTITISGNLIESKLTSWFGPTIGSVVGAAGIGAANYILYKAKAWCYKKGCKRDGGEPGREAQNKGDVGSSAKPQVKNDIKNENKNNIAVNVIISPQATAAGVLQPQPSAVMAVPPPSPEALQSSQLLPVYQSSELMDKINAIAADFKSKSWMDASSSFSSSASSEPAPSAPVVESDVNVQHFGGLLKRMWSETEPGGDEIKQNK